MKFFTNPIPDETAYYIAHGSAWILALFDDMETWYGESGDGWICAWLVGVGQFG